MPTVQETQAFLAELNAPSIITGAQIRAGLATFSPGVGKVIEQSGLLGRLAQSSELAEPDAALRALYEEFFQQVNAMRRIGGELERQSRQLDACFRGIQGVAGRINEAATAAGY